MTILAILAAARPMAILKNFQQDYLLFMGGFDFNNIRDSNL